MTHREPRNRVAPDPEERERRRGDRLPRQPASERDEGPGPAVDPSEPDRSGAFPWRVEGPNVARALGRPAGPNAAQPPFQATPVGDRLLGPTAADAEEEGRRSAARGSSASRAVPVPPHDPTDPAAWVDTPDAWQAPEPSAAPVPTRQRSRATAPAGRSRPAPRERRPPRSHVSLPTPRLPAFAADSDVLHDRTALTLFVVGGVGVAAMAAVLSSQLGDLPSSLPLHLDAAGQPDRWGPPRVLWRLPLLAGMTTLINFVLAWFLAPYDRFAGRFLLAAALVVQVIAWVAIFDFL